MNELHKPVRRRFDKHIVFAKQVNDIWTADLFDMSSLSRSNKGNKYTLTVIDVFSKYGWIIPLKPRLVKRLHKRFGNCSSTVILVVCGRIRVLNSTS